MHIKVIDTGEAEIREVDVFVHVVQTADNHTLPADTKTVSAAVGKYAISYDSNSCTIITPFEPHVEIKDWKDTRYKKWIPVNNRRSLADWFNYARLLFCFGNVGVYIDSCKNNLCENQLEIYVNENMTVYIDGNPVVTERSDTCISK